jgi:hypothetical protein
MPSSIVVLASDRLADAAIDRISADLSKLGFNVDRAKPDTAGRSAAAKIEAAHRVIMLWSRAAARGTPALRAALRRARAKGTLVCVGSNAPPSLACAKRVARVPLTGAAWRGALLRPQPMAAAGKRTPARKPPIRARRKITAGGDKRVDAIATQATPSRSAPILGFFATILVFAAAVSAGMYQTDAGFAAKVNTLAREAQVRVAALTGMH